VATKKRNGLTERQWDELGNLLRQKRDALRARLQELSEQRIVELEPDPIDTASDVTAENDGDALSVHDTYLLSEINSALARMESGRYGLSVESGEPIPYERLRSIPWARRTADEEEERAIAAMR
jgi:RNA polymerase-binding transcription factor DksA